MSGKKHDGKMTLTNTDQCLTLTWECGPEDPVCCQSTDYYKDPGPQSQKTVTARSVQNKEVGEIGPDVFRQRDEQPMNPNYRFHWSEVPPAKIRKQMDKDDYPRDQSKSVPLYQKTLISLAQKL